MLTRLSRTEQLFTRAQKLHLLDRYEESVEVFEQAHKHNPTHTGISLHRALALSDVACFDKAYEVLCNAIKLQPSNPVLYMFLGQISFDHENYIDTLKYCKKALKHNPLNVHARGLMMLVSLAQGQVDEAYQSLTRPPPNQWGNVCQVLHRHGLVRLPSTVQLANLALQSRILLTVETYAWQKNLAVRSLSQQLVEQQQNASSNLAYRGLEMIDTLLTYSTLGIKQSFIVLKYAGNKKRRDESRLRIKADKSYYLCQTSSAITAYENILQKMPESVDVKQRLLELYYESGKFDAALSTLKQLIHYGTSEHNPGPSESLLLGELLYVNGQSDEAIHYLRQALESPLSEFKHFYYCGLNDLKSGRKVSARQQFAKALGQLNPNICRLRLDELKRVDSNLPSKEDISEHGADTGSHTVCFANESPPFSTDLSTIPSLHNK